MILSAWRLRRARRRGFPAAWRAALEQAWPRFARLPADDRATLEDHVLRFLSEKRFEGAAGLRLTDEVRLAVSAQACLLTLRRDGPLYPGLYSVIVYPDAYVAAHRARDEIGLIREGPQVRQGETAARGAVVVAWAAARQGARGPNGGRNVVFHEFAHLLDAEQGGFDGAPRLSPAVAGDWARVMAREYNALRARLDAGLPTPLDAYAAASPAEFFAVATERFFQDPHGLAGDLPVLFDELAGFYRLDPRAWESPTAETPAGRAGTIIARP